jgi:hypothetical protein
MMSNLLTNASTRVPSLLGLGTALLGLVIYFVSPKTAPASRSLHLMKIRLLAALLSLQRCVRLRPGPRDRR